jgi:hypothetical protein
VTYRIHVKREGPGNQVALSVDGKPVPGDIVLAGAGVTEVSVEVTLR